MRVSNDGFESPAVKSEGPLPTGYGWSFSAQSNPRLVREPTALGPNTTDYGQQFAFVFDAGNSGLGMWQDMSEVYVGGQVYEVSVALGRSKFISYQSFVSLELRNQANVAIRFRSIPASQTPINAFAVYTLSYRVPYGAAYAQQPVRVGLSFSGSGPSPGMDFVSVCKRDRELTTSTTSTTSTSTTSSTSSTSTSSTLRLYMHLMLVESCSNRLV